MDEFLGLERGPCDVVAVRNRAKRSAMICRNPCER
jgi:hypothetical protein